MALLIIIFSIVYTDYWPITSVYLTWGLIICSKKIIFSNFNGISKNLSNKLEKYLKYVELKIRPFCTFVG